MQKVDRREDADFLMAYNLALDLRGRRLVDLSDYSAFQQTCQSATGYTTIHEL